jgi:hypothetical protein
MGGGGRRMPAFSQKSGEYKVCAKEHMDDDMLTHLKNVLLTHAVRLFAANHFLLLVGKVGGGEDCPRYETRTIRSKRLPNQI